MELYQKAEEERKRVAMEKISEPLNDEDYENMRESSSRFREDFKL